MPLGDTLVVYAGMHDYYARKIGRRPLSTSASTSTASRSCSARIGNDDGWRRFELDTRALAGTRHAVTFHVSAANPAWRNFGFHAEARR